MHRILTLKTVSTYCSAHITPVEVRLMRRFCALQRSPWLSALFKTASRLGDWPLWVVTAVVLFGWGARSAQIALVGAALAIALSVVLFMLVKNLIGRPRPYEVWDQVPCLMLPPDKFSFPSGHTMTAFAVCGSFAILLPGVVPFYLPMAILIGLSRIFLGVHYPSDVLAGALLGTGLGVGSAHLVLLPV